MNREVRSGALFLPALLISIPSSLLSLGVNIRRLTQLKLRGLAQEIFLVLRWWVCALLIASLTYSYATFNNAERLLDKLSLIAFRRGSSTATQEIERTLIEKERPAAPRLVEEIAAVEPVGLFITGKITVLLKNLREIGDAQSMQQLAELCRRHNVPVRVNCLRKYSLNRRMNRSRPVIPVGKGHIVRV